jgi:hypothetical protein
MSQNSMLSDIYRVVKVYGSIVSPDNCSPRWELLLPNNVLVSVLTEDAGYSRTVAVKGLVCAYVTYDGHDIVKYMRGSERELTTVYRMVNEFKNSH